MQQEYSEPLMASQLGEQRREMRIVSVGKLLILALVLASTAACGPGYIQGTRIEATDSHVELADIVERYRVAVEQRDGDALRNLVSPRYYENGSTTDDPKDDYDVTGLQTVFDKLGEQVKSVKYEIKISDIEVLGSVAHVDFDYTTQFRYSVGEQDRWGTVSDRNRLTFQMESGSWRIVSGL